MLISSITFLCFTFHPSDKQAWEQRGFTLKLETILPPCHHQMTVKELGTKLHPHAPREGHNLARINIFVLLPHYQRHRLSKYWFYRNKIHNFQYNFSSPFQSYSDFPCPKFVTQFNSEDLALITENGHLKPMAWNGYIPKFPKPMTLLINHRNSLLRSAQIFKLS